MIVVHHFRSTGEWVFVKPLEDDKLEAESPTVPRPASGPTRRREIQVTGSSPMSSDAEEQGA